MIRGFSRWHTRCLEDGMTTSTKGAAMILSTELSNEELSEVQGGRLETCIPMPLPEPFPLPWPGDGFPEPPFPPPYPTDLV